MRGGSKPGERRGGRKAGVPNKSKKDRETISAVKSSGITPLEYLLSIVHDEAQTQSARVDASKAAAPYVHPRLTTSEVKVSLDLASELGEAQERVRKAVARMSPELRQTLQ